MRSHTEVYVLIPFFFFRKPASSLQQARKRIDTGSDRIAKWPRLVTIFGWSTKKHLHGNVLWLEKFGEYRKHKCERECTVTEAACIGGQELPTPASIAFFEKAAIHSLEFFLRSELECLVMGKCASCDLFCLYVCYTMMSAQGTWKRPWLWWRAEFWST